MTQKPASWEKRAINFIIDIIVIQFINLFSLAIVGMVLYNTSNLSGEVTYEISNNYYVFIVFIIYYVITESFFKKSIGKLITKTTVISSDGEKLKFMQILVRSITRLLFIEILSYFKKEPIGWHDSISKTLVVNNNNNVKS